MASLALFLQQCLTEEKYGTTFISELDQRLESLNYIQLVKMHDVLIKASKAAKMKVWKEGNDNIIKNVEKWLEIRKKEHDIIEKREEEVLRRIRHKQKLKELNEREKIRVIEQLKEKARKAAEQEIKTIEIERKAKYKQTLFEVVERAEKKRNYHIIFGLLFFIIGCVACGLFIKDIIIIIAIIGGLFIIMLFIFYRAYRVSQVAPYDDHPDTIEKQIKIREKELFHESMELIHQHEREYDEKMLEDKLERKKRKKEKKRHEEILQYLENHPEIIIKDPTGDLEAQLMEALRKKDPSFRHDNDSDNSDNDNDNGNDSSDNDNDDIEKNKKQQDNIFKSDHKMNIIFEESGDENDLSSRKDESGKISSIKGIDLLKKNLSFKSNNNNNNDNNNQKDMDLFIAPGKESNEIPETTNSWKQNKSNSLKYVSLNQNNDNDNDERNFDIEEGGNNGKGLESNESISIKKIKSKDNNINQSNLQILQIILTDFISSFMENTTEYSDIYIKLLIKYSSKLNQDKDIEQNLSYNNQIYQTDSQKCVGETINWKINSSDKNNIIIENNNNNNDSMIKQLLYPIEIPLMSSSILLTLTFQLYSIRPTNTLLATGIITSDELYSSIQPKSKKNQSIIVPMIRNDIIKVCNLKLNCKIEEK